tara:strand:- start:7846 stop:8721 length:876 start_codon:yes stop_codon:yes gene_type:complete
MQDNIQEYLKAFKNLKVAVVGETITDEFVPVKYQGQSMKSFCPVFELMEGEVQKQLGGAGAIARHLKNFVGKLDLYSNNPEDIIKTRYLDINSGQKHLEFNKFSKHNFETVDVNCNEYDVVIVADFGHGYCDHLNINDGFHLMCQTNSNNFGFNRLSKWKTKRKASVCIDLREASLQLNHKIAECTPEIMKELFNYELSTDQLYVTIGKKGAVYTDGNEVDYHHSYPTKIVDTIGAGDAFFSFSALTARIAKGFNEKLRIPSLAASLTTTWLCNEFDVTPDNLKDHANKYL